MKEEKKVKLSKLQDSSVGFPAIRSVGYYIWEETYVGRGVKTLFKLNQPDGFDCPSCAWPDPDADKVSGIAEYCENGAKSVAWEATKNKVGEDFFKKYPLAELLQQSDHWLEKQGRLIQPMILREGSTHYETIEWKEAFAIIASQLNGLSHPDDAVFYTSGRASNEAAFLYQTFVRQFGTNNLPDCSNMCHEASGKALRETLGIGKASVTLDDIADADVLINIGQNAGTNSPRMLTALQQLKKNGGKIIAVNPLPEAGFMHFRHPQKPWEWIGQPTQLQDLYLSVKINGDLALLKAIMWLLIKEDKQSGGQVFDHSFIESQTVGFEDFVKNLKQYKIEELVQASGISLDQLEQVVAMIKSKSKIIIAWAMGVTQHRNAESTIREIVNLLLLKGAIGKRGAGTLPVRGHSNVQGDRTMGIWEKMPDAFLDRMERVFDFQAPRNQGYGTVDAIKAMAGNKVKFFMGLGGNFALAAPDTDMVFKGLGNCDMTVHISTKLNRSHLVHGKTALILPCLGRTESDLTAKGPQFVSTEDTAGRVRMSMGDLPPASEALKSEVGIICGIAKATLKHRSSTDWQAFAQDYDLVRDKIEQVIDGFESYNQRVRKAGGFYLPNCNREGKFDTSDKKAHFTSNPLPENTIHQDHFILMTIRSHDQFNTSIYGFNDRYRGINQSREVVLMHEEDMKKLGIEPEERVDLTSIFNQEKRVLKHLQAVPYPITRGCVGVYFPEGNVLVAIDNKSPESHCPASKFVEVSIQKAQKT
ncbi:FdhF/YdeP family oxidoreductase [Pararhodonellum marinum]|uniref:FdhF/YdeP family oxidoreductase n=1 Tax=Pararhodonellum marinum TaxID=2755358 RepID=UPI00188DC728|nr:FdhF/YdeP family oxidoreductase [Pararhodonellum marinum]